jgi:hypothetical protein
LRAYWTQQLGYGKARPCSEEVPEKYNGTGQLTLAASCTAGLRWPRGGPGLQGTWGSAPFQLLYQPGHSWFSSLMLIPEWYLLIALFGTLALIGLLWKPLLIVLPLF